jgi:hypothetical protein
LVKKKPTFQEKPPRRRNFTFEMIFYNKKRENINFL